MTNGENIWNELSAVTVGDYWREHTKRNSQNYFREASDSAAKVNHTNVAQVLFYIEEIKQCVKKNYNSLDFKTLVFLEKQIQKWSRVLDYVTSKWNEKEIHHIKDNTGSRIYSIDIYNALKTNK